MTHRQFRLKTVNGGNTEMMTWLKDDKRLQHGKVISLKDWWDPDQLWLIAWRSETVTDENPTKTWKVGGLP